MPEHPSHHAGGSTHLDHDGHPYEIWDVFTATPLEGNPLGVFPVGEEIPSRLHQKLARELNLSETVFILPDDPAEADAHIRIYTPQTELPFAGHPTLGAAYAISARHGYQKVRLRTGAGIVEVTMTRNEHGEIAGGEMRQPVPTYERFEYTEALLAVLGVQEPSTLPVDIYTNGPSHVVVTVRDRETLRALVPDMSALARLGEVGVAVIARGDTASSGDAGHQVFSRNFCPGLGVPEDPATGSAAGPVAVHLLRHGQITSGETVTITQGVEIGRPSALLATAHGDAENIKLVTVAGSAVKVAAGHYQLS